MVGHLDWKLVTWCFRVNTSTLRTMTTGFQPCLCFKHSLIPPEAVHCGGAWDVKHSVHIQLQDKEGRGKLSDNQQSIFFKSWSSDDKFLILQAVLYICSHDRQYLVSVAKWHCLQGVGKWKSCCYQIWDTPLQWSKHHGTTVTFSFFF